MAICRKAYNYDGCDHCRKFPSNCVRPGEQISSRNLLGAFRNPPDFYFSSVLLSLGEVIDGLQPQPTFPRRRRTLYPGG